MKRRLWFFVVPLLLCVACHDKDEEEIIFPASHKVVVVYMMAENSLTGNSETDLSEMRTGAAYIPDDCRLVVFLDNSDENKKPQILTIDNTNKETVIHEFSTDIVSTDSATMQNVLALILRRCPAERYGLVLWSHGSGWIPEPRNTIGIDNGKNNYSNKGTELESPTLAHILLNTGVHWDYIMFDACFMQCIEVAYQLRHVTSWCIGSPAEIPANGAPYHQLMGALFQDEGYAENITKTYYDFYATHVSSWGVILSAIQCSEIEALANATRPHIATRNIFPTTDVQTYCTYCEKTLWKPEYFDMGSTMHKWLTEEEYATWSEVFARAVPFHYEANRWPTIYTSVLEPKITDPEHAAAVSMYIPIEGRDELNKAFRQTDWYKATGWATSYPAPAIGPLPEEASPCIPQK